MKTDSLKLLQMKENILIINKVEICTESFGNNSDIPIILIMGAAASMMWWDEEFCERLARRNRFVIRFDNRDTGKSTCYEPGKPEYNLNDMTDDIKGILDAYGIKRVHLVGMSLGGMIAQIFALRYPSNLLTLTLISSSVFAPDTPDLAPADEKILKYRSSGDGVDWNNEKSVIKYMAEGWRLLNGSRHPFDEKKAYRIAAQEIKRANNFLSMFNHALLKGGEEYYGRIHEISVPSLIIHGTEDPVLPYLHGIALKNELQNSRILTLPGRGHEIHYFDYDVIIDNIERHTSRVCNSLKYSFVS